MTRRLVKFSRTGGKPVIYYRNIVTESTANSNTILKAEHNLRAHIVYLYLKQKMCAWGLILLIHISWCNRVSAKKSSGKKSTPTWKCAQKATFQSIPVCQNLKNTRQQSSSFYSAVNRTDNISNSTLLVFLQLIEKTNPAQTQQCVIGCYRSGFTQTHTQEAEYNE